jgi:hypothetical protein
MCIVQDKMIDEQILTNALDIDDRAIYHPSIFYQCCSVHSADYISPCFLYKDLVNVSACSGWWNEITILRCLVQLSKSKQLLDCIRSPLCRKGV